MNIYLSILMILFILTIYMLILSLGIKKKSLSVFFSFLSALILISYLTQYIFLSAQSPEFLFNIRHFIFLSFPSAGLMSFIFINKCDNHLMSKKNIILLIIIFIAFSWTVIACPEKIMPDILGYRVVLYDKLAYCFYGIEGLFSIYMIYMSLKKFLLGGPIGHRVVNIAFFLGYTAAIAESLALLFNKPFMRFPIVSELLIIPAIIYSMIIIKDNIK